jgi:hypothetical protein
VARIFLKAADHTKKATFNGTLVLQTLSGEMETKMTTHDPIEGFNTNHPFFGRNPPQPVFIFPSHSYYIQYPVE